MATPEVAQDKDNFLAGLHGLFRAGHASASVAGIQCKRPIH